jgi:hypothetical protein
VKIRLSFSFMGISAIRERSNQFVANLDKYIQEAIEEVSQELTQINRDQMLDSLQPSGKPIFPFYSPSYAKKKGFPYPNLFVTGDFQNDMFMVVQDKEFFLTSGDWKNPLLTEKYERSGNKIFGIPKEKEKQAQEISLSSLSQIYNRFVLND